jgi:hypothetical protein
MKSAFGAKQILDRQAVHKNLLSVRRQRTVLTFRALT